MAKNKFYGVRKGFNTGIYDNWSEASAQINGFSGAEYKGFPTRAEAEAFMNGGLEFDTNEHIDETDLYRIYVDGSFKEDMNSVGFGIVVTKNGEILHRDAGRVPTSDTSQRNVIGEIYASIRTIQIAIANDYKNICICYDYEGIEKWINGSWEAKTPLSKRYIEYINKYKSVLNISFNHVYGHSGDVFNEEADRLAKLGCGL